MRISDVQALTERMSSCEVLKGLIEEGEERTEMRELFLSPNCLYARLTLAVCLFALTAAAESGRRCSGVNKVRRRGHGTVIGYGQAVKKRGGRSNTSWRGNHLPLAEEVLAGEVRDLGDGGSSAAVRGGDGSKSVFS